MTNKMYNLPCYSVLFFSDQTRKTTWIHPVRGLPIGTGYNNREGKPSLSRILFMVFMLKIRVMHFKLNTNWSDPPRRSISAENQLTVSPC